MKQIRRSIRRKPAATFVLVSTVVAVIGTGGVAVAAGGPHGTTPADAAASCWEIKQNDPGAADGVYWLQTPQLVAPEQFYCDMTTDGGGWVLVGRGRQGWRPEYQGQGTPAEVRGTVTGPDAFRVATLSSKTVDALLGGRRVDALADGIRVRRAMNAEGTQWQEARFKPAGRDRWVWSFAAPHPVASFDFGGRFGSGTGGTTTSFGTNNSYHRIETRESDPGQGWAAGWSFGESVRGTNSPTSYLWSGTDGAGYARPFTQLYLRPKLTSSQLSYPAVPDGGTPAHALTPLLQSGAEPQQWGVTGRVQDPASEHFTEAQTATQIGDTVFVGGNFAHVQQGANGQQIDQRFLAGFDVHTGGWDSAFRPTFNGQVKSLAALPSGKLIVGGEFTQVDGQSVDGLVALDPATGAIDPTWTVAVENRLSCCAVKVWTMQVHGKWLYLGGSFTHLKGGNQQYPVFARNAARVSVADGTADPDWNPNFNGTVYDLDISADGTRFYAAGHMTWSDQNPTDSMAVVSTAPGAALVPGLQKPHFSAPNPQAPNSKHYQQTVVEAGDRVWLGGSEHSLFSYARSDFGLLSTNITKAGGDFQASLVTDGVLYAGCHCGNWNFSGADSWPDVGDGWAEADKIDYVGAWDTATGSFLPGFDIWANTTHGQGLWGEFRDSTGKVWMLGDFSKVRSMDGRFEWVGGFMRFTPRDTVVPGAPGDLTSSDLGDGTAKLSWSGATDDRGSVRYEVLRDDRVIATTDGTSTVVPLAGEAHRYFVRAVDAAGNRSASTPVHVVGG